MTWLVVLFGLPSMAAATTITLSQASSDETPASQLSATLDFDVTGATLDLTVTNLTDGSLADFNISEIFFNASDDVTSLALDSTTASGNWVLNTSVFDSGGFGEFEYQLISSDTPAAVIDQVAIFTFEINGGVGDFDMADFVGADTFSTIPPGSDIAQAAAKFVQCTGVDCVKLDDSAFGAANGPGFPPIGAPEPGAAALLALGILGFGALRRSRS